MNIGSTAFERLYILRGMHRGFRLCKRILGLDMYALRVLLIGLLDRRPSNLLAMELHISCMQETECSGGGIVPLVEANGPSSQRH